MNIKRDLDNGYNGQVTWCATFKDFENLAVSPAGFGKSKIGATISLLVDYIFNY